jgi:hypothetical protein
MQQTARCADEYAIGAELVDNLKLGV